MRVVILFGACVVKCFCVHCLYVCLVTCCVLPVWFRLAAPSMDPPLPSVLSCLRAAIPVSYVLLLRLGGVSVTPAVQLSEVWRCPLRVLDDLHALLCRSCESPECELAAGAGLWEFSCWRALEPSVEVLQRRWQCLGICSSWVRAGTQQLDSTWRHLKQWRPSSMPCKRHGTENEDHFK